MSIVNDARAILACLQPLTGTRSSGNAVVTASPGPTVVLPANACAVPVIGGAIRYDRMVKVAKNPASSAGWTVGTATVVPMISNIGGADMNLPAGTPLRWWPAVPGVEAVSAVDGSGMTGGTLATGLTAIAQLAFFEDLAVPNLGEMLAKASISRFPAVVLAWEGSGDYSPIGRGQWTQQQQWGLYVIASRNDAEAARRLEGVVLLDAVCDQIWGQQEADGFHFSTPSGAQITGRKMLGASDRFYVYRASFTTGSSSNFKETRAFNPWTKTKLNASTADVVPLPLIVDNITPNT